MILMYWVVGYNHKFKITKKKDLVWLIHYYIKNGLYLLMMKNIKNILTKIYYL